MAQREIQHVVEHAIDELPEAFRLVFITRVIEGMNVEETAEILGLKPETVKTRLHRARNMLRDNRREEDRPGGDGSVSVCRQALRTADGRGAEAAGFRVIISGTSAPQRHPTPVQSTTRRPFAPAPQECQTMFVRLSAAIAALSLLTGAALAQGAKPTDPQIAHIAYTAGVIDIAAAKQAIDEGQQQGRQGVRAGHGARP